MPRPVDKKADYFPGLDGLRALAVVLVVAYHLGVPFASGGLLGVGVFFTLSGFLITSLLLRRHEKHGDLDLKNFWIRRFRRLLPAVVLVLIAVLAAGAVVRPEKLGAWSEQALAALLYVANWHTILSGRSYFEQQEGAGPLDHLWSLAVEEQFYLVWPLALLLLLTLTRRLGRRPRTAALAGVALALGAVSMVLLAVLADPTGDSTRAYEGTDTRAGGLLWGAALAFLWRPDAVARVRGAAVWAVDAVGVAGLAGILALVATTDQQTDSLYTWGIAALTVSTCAALLPLVHPEARLGRVLGIAPLQWIGARSYGIYLWHMPVVAFLPERAFYGQPVVRGLVVVALTLVLAALSWRFVEDPIRRHGLLAVLTGRAAADRTPPREPLVDHAAGGSTAPAAVGPRRPALAALAVTAAAALALGGLTALPQTSTRDIVAQEAADGDDGTAAQGVDDEAAVAVPPSASPAASGQAGTSSRPSASGQAAAAGTASSSSPAVAPTATSCTTVVHIGDSSSLASGNTDRTSIEDPDQRITARYEAVGARKVIEDIRPGRSTTEPFLEDPGHTTAPQAMRAHLDAMDEDSCFVVAIGLNDAATMNKGEMWSEVDRRIDRVMEAADGHRVLWVDSVIMPWAPIEWYTTEGTARFNEAVVAATKRHPNLWVYDWAKEAGSRPEWFLEMDPLHNTTEGAVAKAERMAEALVVAFPEGREPSTARVVRTE